MVTELEQATITEANEAIAYALAQIDGAIAGGFRPTALQGLPPPVRAEVQQWHTNVLRTASLDSPGTQYAVYLGDGELKDVVRIAWQQDEFDVVEYQTRAVVAVWLPPKRVLAQPAGTPLEEFTRLSTSLFNVSADFRPRPPSPQEQGLAITTGPTVSVYSMPNWSDRVDAGMHAGHVHFLFYKRHPQLLGLGLNQRWFDDEFRRRHR
jgi:hypothetical protein